MKGTTVSVEILEYKKEYALDFASLNYEWLIEYFQIEAHDREMLDHPDEYIIGRGGQIFFALISREVVGTVALIPVDAQTYELAKMAVAPAYKGLKIGRRLLQAAIEYARKQGKEKLILESSTRMTPAINLYLSAGFRTIPLDPNTPYARCDVRMEMTL